jgi:hypothetical protein
MKQVIGWLAAGTSAALILVGAVVGGTQQAYAQQPTNAAELYAPVALDVGGTTLQPGTYRIEVVKLDENRNMLQVKSTDGMTLFATVLSIPHATVAGEVMSENRFVYYPAAAGVPRVLRTWYEMDRSSGHDIVYPKARALELAATLNEPVLAMPTETKQADYVTAPVVIVTPEKQEKPYVFARKVDPPVQIAEAKPVEELPRTASHVPLFALLGALAVGGALGLRAFAAWTA